MVGRLGLIYFLERAPVLLGLFQLLLVPFYVFVLASRFPLFVHCIYYNLIII